MKLLEYSTEDFYENGMREYPLFFRGLYAVILGILFAFSKVMWRCSIEGEERVTQSGTGCVVICNHTSMAEVIITVVDLWRRGRRVRPLFKSEFANSSFVEWAFARVGGIILNRGTADLKAVRRAQHALQRGEDILIYPEGTRVRSDDQPVEMHGGFALIASMAKAPVVPMAVVGARDITPAGKRIPRPVKVWIRAGGPVRLSDAPEGLKRREKCDWMEAEALSRMTALRDELRAEHPGRR